MKEGVERKAAYSDHLCDEVLAEGDALWDRLGHHLLSLHLHPLSPQQRVQSQQLVTQVSAVHWRDGIYRSVHSSLEIKPRLLHL